MKLKRNPSAIDRPSEKGVSQSASVGLDIVLKYSRPWFFVGLCQITDPEPGALALRAILRPRSPAGRLENSLLELEGRLLGRKRAEHVEQPGLDRRLNQAVE